ncbi:MAG TPA: O-antigen ligase family protein, partial [Candidatus Polarisedimenticolia bacterium]|nr:O-antigen ligase family protein [Candidatus Polarisedimenticolia bacterium]
MGAHLEMHGTSRLEKTLDILIRGGLLLLVVLAPLPFGSVEPWAYSTLELGVAGLALLYLYRLFLFPASTTVSFSPLLFPAIGFLLLMGAQLLPLPPGVLRFVSPETSALYEATLPGAPQPSVELPKENAQVSSHPRHQEPDWRPLTQVSYATRTYLLKGVAFSLFLFLFLNAFRGAILVRRALYLLVAVGTFQAFYGVLEYLSGHQHIFAYQKKYYTDAATGTFINRNHYAAFLEMTLLVALGLFFSRWREPHAGETWRERLLALTDRRASLNMTLLLCIGIVSVGLVLSYSRAGIILGLATAGLFCLVQLRHGWTFQKTLLMALLIAVVFVPIYGVGYWTLTGRYALLSGEMTTPGSRMAVWRKTAEIIRDYPFLGTGVGTFQYVFPRYRDSTTTAFYDFTHSDYLQVFSEAGALGVALLAAGVFLVAKAWRGNPREARSGETVLRSACGFALLAVGLHEALDFSLQIPANLLAATFLA